MFHWDAYYIERAWEHEAGLADREWRGDRVEQPIPLSWVLIWLGVVFLPAFGIWTAIGWLS